MIVISSRRDIDLAAYRRVAWEGEGVLLGDGVAERMAAAREAFVQLMASDSNALVYGVTTGQGDRANRQLTDTEREQWEQQLPVGAASFGEPFPERVVRGIVLARLANFVDGHGGVRPEIAQEIAAMLDGRELPEVPSEGNGGSGEVHIHAHLFRGLVATTGLQLKEPMAIINGAPCQAALVADMALSAERRARIAARVFALAAEAFLAPAEHYDGALEALWSDEDDTTALRAFRALLDGGETERRRFQAPVSFRIAPRLIGQAHRTARTLAAIAETALPSVTDNPVFIPPDDAHPLGAVISNGGFHIASSSAALHDVAAAWAELCQLACHQTERILAEPAALERQRYVYGSLRMVQAAWADDARFFAQPALLPLSGQLQTDTGSVTYSAWRRTRDAGRCLDAALAILAVLATEALFDHSRPAPSGLASLVAAVSECRAPGSSQYDIGAECQRLASHFSNAAFTSTLEPLTEAPWEQEPVQR